MNSDLIKKSPSRIPKFLCKPIQTELDYIAPVISQTPKSLQLDLKKLRTQRSIQKQYGSISDRSPREEHTLDKLSSVEAEWMRYKSVGKQRPEENKLVFHKEVRPQSALRPRPVESPDLIRLAQTAIGLLEKSTLEVVDEIPETKKMKTPERKKQEINLEYRPLHSKLNALKSTNFNQTQALSFKKVHGMTSPSNINISMNKTQVVTHSDLMRIIKSAKAEIETRPLRSRLSYKK